MSLAKRVDERPVVVLADRNLLQQRAQKLGLVIKFLEYSGQAVSSLVGELYIEHVPLETIVVDGQLNAANAAYVLEQLRRSADYAMSGKSVGVATAPVQKSVIQLIKKHQAVMQFKTQLEADESTGNSAVLSSSAISRLLMPYEVYLSDSFSCVF
ncbi:4-hydroxythreonine-4-phosphate dehydrogenase PdxA [Klebsiella pneumoniae]